MTTTVVVDTGPLVAVADRDDAHHHRCVDGFDHHRGPVIVPTPVIVGVCWLLDGAAGPPREQRSSPAR